MYQSQIYGSPSPKVSNFEFNEILPKAMIFIANNDSPMSVFEFHQNLGLQHEMTHH